MTTAQDSVLREEAEFADRDYAPYASSLEIDPGMFGRYAVPTDVSDWRQMSALLLGDVSGKELLDFGCGMGEEAIYFAKLGAHVTGIDISEVGITSLRERAAFHHLDVTALQMRVDPTPFADDSFDLVHGLGILHHVGIGPGLTEVHRVLRPGGTAVFLEPLGDNRAVETAKTWMMNHARFLGEFDHVTDHERNLTWREIAQATAQFDDAASYPYHLLYRLKRLFPSALASPLRHIDHAVLDRFPRLRRFAGAVVIRVRKSELVLQRSPAI